MALINGGAAVAILAYLGNIASHTPPPSHMPHMRSALLSYSAGVLATALAFIGEYATQLRLYSEERGAMESPSANLIRLASDKIMARVQMSLPQFLRALNEEVPRVMDRHSSGC